MNKFTHLHLHTHYSLLDGLTKPSALITRVKELGMDSVAITDHGNMFGALEFYKMAKAEGIKPIIGCEVYVCNDMLQKTLTDNKLYHLTLLAMNSVGYHNLIKLVSEANLRGFYYKPRIDFDLLTKYNEGLICLSGCLGGQLSQFILQNQKADALALAQKYQKLFGDRYYIELQRHPRNKDQCVVTPSLIRLAKKIRVPVVATGDSHYINKEDKHIHEVLLAVNTGSSLDDKNRFSVADSDVYLASPKEMVNKFIDIPEAINNTQVIADRCNLDIELGKHKFPRFDVPKGYSADSCLEILSFAGLLNLRLNKKREYVTRLEYELEVIKKTGFATYLLIVQDIVAWAKKHKIGVGPGRGSAAGSLICYCLGITTVDPIKYGLLFERFMNPERVSMPDIDMDFDDTRREEVINYVTEKYGKNHVAQIVTFGTMFARSSIRDAGRALGYDLATCDRIAKMIPFMQSLSDALETSTELQAEYKNAPSRKLIDVAIKLEGVVRHAGIHACGVVIADKPITHYAPVMVSKEGHVTSQYDMNMIGDIGLLKMDFLGLRNLSVISEAQQLIKHDTNKVVDINNVPLDDRITFELLQNAQTTSVFQLESGGMKRYLKELRPTNIEDVTVLIALYRPGPMELIPEYIVRKHGKKSITYLHPSLEPVLRDTYGIMIYQEQLIRAVQVLAGFSLAEADVLRMAIGKKNKKLLDEQEDKFKLGCKQNNIPDRIAEKFWALVEPFNRYGFNKSHAVCYAMLAYQTAYLKAHYPLQFMIAELNSSKDIERIKEVITELSNMKIKILPPSINSSQAMFSGSGREIRFGLSAIKGMNNKIIDNIISARKLGKFINLEDFILRIAGDLNKKVIGLLAQSGAIDDWGNRADINAMAEIIALYGRLEVSNALPKIVIPKMSPPTIGQKLVWEKELLGLYVSANPIKNYYDALKDRGAINISTISQYYGKKITIGGVIAELQKKFTKNKRTMYLMRLEDTTGEIEIPIFEGIYNKFSKSLAPNNIVLVSGTAQANEGGVRFVCLGISKLASLT